MTRLFTLLLIFSCSCLFAQDISRQQSLDSAALRYLRTANRQSALFQGGEQDGQPRSTNHPYLKEALYAKARLSYHDVIYPEALLRLDLSRDELIAFSPDFRHVILFPENVDFVELHGKHIIFFSRDNLPGCPSSGYYFLLYSGQCKVIEKVTATLMSENDGGNRMRYYYAFTTRYYLYRDGVYYTIRNQRGLLNALSPHKKELKRFISASRMNFRDNAEYLLTRTVTEYEKLTGSL